MEKEIFPDFNLSGEIAIVTGAGRGMGYHMAIALAKYGADVVVCSRTVAELEKVAGAIESLGRRALIQQMDVCRVPEIHRMVEETVKAFGRIDILVNNAGTNRPQWAVDVTEENWDLLLNTNLKGLFFCAQTAGKVMIQQKKGKIINISSDAGTVGLPRREAYCSSKGAITQLTKVLAIEWAEHNINVNAIAPAFVETPFTAPMFKEPGFREWVLSNTPGPCGKYMEYYRCGSLSGFGSLQLYNGSHPSDRWGLDGALIFVAPHRQEWRII